MLKITMSVWYEVVNIDGEIVAKEVLQALQL